MKILGSRVDGLILGYRVTLFSAFTEKLRDRGGLAVKHGRASFEWGGDDGVCGELGYTRVKRAWNIVNEPYFRMRIDEQAPGAVEGFDDRTGDRVQEAGWTIEIVFYAQWLADIGLERAIKEADRLAALCGKVHEQKLARVDLCADIEGWEIRKGDVDHLVKRPRAKYQREFGEVGVGKETMPGAPSADKARPTRTERADEGRAQDFGRGALSRRQQTGLSVGRGGAMMARIYDKRAELERDERRRANEERRWRHEAGCPILAAVERDERAECRGACSHCQRWDGETRVTRIEFQIRGGVIKEYGLRDPSRALDVQTALDDRGRLRVIGHRVAVDGDGVVLGLVDRLDWLWRSCIDWVRLVELEYTEADPTKLKPASRLPLDERWKLLQEVKFAAARAPHPIRRFRVRAAASAAMGLGVALAQAARDGELVRWAENTGAYDAETAEATLRERIAKIKEDEAERIVQWLIEDKGGAIGALVHLSVRNNAARRRFKERIVGDDAALSTGPPDGDGAGTRATARGGGAHKDGSREEGRAVA